MDHEAGITKINADKCIGCKECAMACPFAAINMHYKTGKAFKCDLCEGREEGPVCAEASNVALKVKRRNKLTERLQAAKVGEEG
jgi:carbon-monoxide dehydrogenase iron sulfur subunit